MAIWLIISLILLLLVTVSYYFFVEKPKLTNKIKSNIIQLQADDFDFILYKGKINELSNDYQRFLGDLDIVIYSKSIFIGYLEPKKVYLDLYGKDIQSVKYQPNKITIICNAYAIGSKQITIKSKSTKQLFLIGKKIDFISRRSKKVSAI